MVEQELPLSGIQVVEFSHMVMGPSVGLVLADMGADVVKVEPKGGDKTRRLLGSGAGYFAMYNRNKRSICVDLKSDQGRELAFRLVRKADVLIENFRPGAMEKLGYGYPAMSALNPRLIYASSRGFLAGPYEHRTALDEVTQMMGGLAYMTGPPGRPLRAGASVIDVLGGMFGVVGVLAALEQRHRTGKGQQITSSLFESTAFLMGQHIAQYAVTGEPAKPMPVRISAWAVYDVFETADQEQLFVAVVSDTQWGQFCEAFQLTEFSQDRGLDLNADRVKQRDRIIPAVQAVFRQFSKADLMDRLEEVGLPFAPISKPQDLIDDPHLNHSGGMIEVSVPGGGTARLPALPVQMGAQRFGLRHDLPEPGEHTHQVLREAGYSESEIEALLQAGVVEGELAASAQA